MIGIAKPLDRVVNVVSQVVGNTLTEALRDIGLRKGAQSPPSGEPDDRKGEQDQGEGVPIETNESIGGFVPYWLEPLIDCQLNHRRPEDAKEGSAQHRHQPDGEHFPVRNGVAADAQQDAQAGSPSSFRSYHTLTRR